MTSQRLKKLGLRNALLFILIAILIFTAYYYTSSNLLIYLEYAFVFIAGAINVIILLRLFNHVVKHRRNRTSLIITGGVILISIITCLFLFQKTTELQDTMRIQFVNKTGFELSDVKVTGCEKKYIDNIKPEESQTVWINISRICSINISYKQNGVLKTEVVAGFINPSEGRKLSYSIMKTN